MSTPASPSPADGTHEETLDHWVDEHAGALLAYARTRLRSREDAEDAVQETFLAAITAKRAFRGDSAQRTWLIGILRHKIVDRIRAAVRREATLEDDSQLEGLFDQRQRWAVAPREWGSDPGAAAERGEFWDQFERCVDDLPERQAQVFLLRTLDDRSTEDICQECGISATNLWVILHRARTRLRACLESTWFAAEEPPP